MKPPHEDRINGGGDPSPIHVPAGPISPEQIRAMQEAFHAAQEANEPSAWSKLIGITLGAAFLATLGGVGFAWATMVYRWALGVFGG